MPARGPRDHRLCVHLEREYPSRAVFHQLGVLRCLVLDVLRSLGQLDAPEPLYVRVSLPARKDQPQRIALLRANRLAILPVRHQPIVHRFLKRDAALHETRVRTFGQDPAGFGSDTCFLEQDAKRHAGPFAAARQTVTQRDVGGTGGTPFAPAVAGALDKVHSGDGRQPLDVVQAEGHRLFHQAMDHQLVVGWVDLRDAGVVALEVQR